jgi:hypothetical protein
MVCLWKAVALWRAFRPRAVVLWKVFRLTDGLSMGVRQMVVPTTVCPRRVVTKDWMKVDSSMVSVLRHRDSFHRHRHLHVLRPHHRRHRPCRGPRRRRRSTNRSQSNTERRMWFSF